MMRHTLAAAVLIAAVLAPAGANAQSISAKDAHAIAKEAYIYRFPLVDSYRIQYSSLLTS